MRNKLEFYRKPYSLFVTAKGGLLTIATGKSCVLLSSVQKVIEKEAWQLLTFFLCLHNQLNSIHPVVTY